LLLRRRAGEGSERWRRGFGLPREMSEDFLDHCRILDRACLSYAADRERHQLVGNA
jgi:hypothetical protein